MTSTHPPPPKTYWFNKMGGARQTSAAAPTYSQLADRKHSASPDLVPKGRKQKQASDPFLQAHWFNSKEKQVTKFDARRKIDPKPSIQTCQEVIIQTTESNSTLSKFLTSTNPKLYAKSPLADSIRMTEPLLLDGREPEPTFHP